MNNIQEYFVTSLQKGKLLGLSQVEEWCEYQEIENESDFSDFLSWYQKVANLDFLASIPNSVEEVYFLNFDLICYYQNQEQISLEIRLTPEEYRYIFEILALKHHISFNYQNPFASFYTELHNVSYRVTLTHQCLGPLNMPKLFLRRINQDTYPLENFIPAENVDFLKDCMKNKKNILLCGATASGKTSLLSSMLKEIRVEEHTIIIEDTFEIPQLGGHYTRLLSNGGLNKELDDFMAYALRMTPKRIILGEMRSKEVIPFVLAMNTGHSGLISTLHANDAQDAIHRLGMLFALYGPEQVRYEQTLKMCAKNIDYVIVLKDKKVIQIAEILGSDNGQVFIENLYSTTPLLYS